MNIWDIVILGMIGIVLFFSIRGLRKRHGMCSGACEGCMYHENCRVSGKESA